MPPQENRPENRRGAYVSALNLVAELLPRDCNNGPRCRRMEGNPDYSSSVSLRSSIAEYAAPS